ncbi:MAG: hypothetical protein KBD29_01005 [Candidatus Magasanikbacteria bacterium]|nr:hypothetical protein [Candidatus Magasanikbacteria bacterium]
MEPAISIRFALGQILNFAIFIGVIYAIVKLVKNSNKTVSSLNEIQSKVNSLSEKIDGISKK